VTPRTKPRGHPAKQDPSVAKLFRTMRAAVELVQELDGRLSAEADVNLRASALGMMHVWAEIAGLPKPETIIGGMHGTD